MDNAGQPCPSGYLTPSTESACRIAANDLGESYTFSSAGNWNDHVGGPGCHVGGHLGGSPNGNVHFNAFEGDCDGCHGFRICTPGLPLPILSSVSAPATLPRSLALSIQDSAIGPVYQHESTCMAV